MKKRMAAKASAEATEMRPEYDFTGGIRGKHSEALRQGYTIEIYKAGKPIIKKRVTLEDTITLAPDVREYFPDSKSVNRALRTLISLVPGKRKAASKRNRAEKREPTSKTRSRNKKL